MGGGGGRRQSQTTYVSYVPDKLNLLPFYHLTFKCDLDLQPTNLRIFFTKNPNLNLKKKKKKFFLRGVGGRVGGEGSWMDRPTGPNQFAPSTSSKLGA